MPPKSKKDKSKGGGKAKSAEGADLTKRFTKEETEALKRQFKTICAELNAPEGLSYEQVKQHISILFMLDDDFCRRMLTHMDLDNSGTIEVHEYLATMAIFYKGDLNDKVKFFFLVWDEDLDGMLNANELATMIKGHLSGGVYDDVVDFQVSDEEANEFAKSLIAKYDTQNKGSLSLQEVVAACSHNDRLLQALSRGLCSFLDEQNQ